MNKEKLKKSYILENFQDSIIEKINKKSILKRYFIKNGTNIIENINFENVWKIRKTKNMQLYLFDTFYDIIYIKEYSCEIIIYKTKDYQISIQFDSDKLYINLTHFPPTDNYVFLQDLPIEERYTFLILYNQKNDTLYAKNPGGSIYYFSVNKNILDDILKYVEKTDNLFDHLQKNQLFEYIGIKDIFFKVEFNCENNRYSIEYSNFVENSLIKFGKPTLESLLKLKIYYEIIFNNQDKKLFHNTFLARLNRSLHQEYKKLLCPKLDEFSLFDRNILNIIVDFVIN
jgi:hypothetical protein